MLEQVEGYMHAGLAASQISHQGLSRELLAETYFKSLSGRGDDTSEHAKKADALFKVRLEPTQSTVTVSWHECDVG